MLTWKEEKIQNVINFPDMILHSLGARCVIIFCPQIEHKNFLVLNLKFQIILYLKAYQNFAFKYISICSCALCDGENNKNGALALVKLLRTTSHA